MTTGKRIDELDAAAPLTGTEVIPLMQTGETKQAAATSLRTFVLDNLTTTDIIEGLNLFYTDSRADARVAVHSSLTDNPHSVTKAQVGLSNVANTLCNFAATTNPTVGDDSGDGYTIGSRWINTSSDVEFICTDASVGAAVWKNITNSAVTLADIGLSNVLNTKHNYSATSAPTVNDDSGDGYSVGSVWVDLTDDEAWVCTDATVGAAVWALMTLDDTTVRSAGSTTQYKIPYWENANSLLNDGLLGTDGQWLKFGASGVPTSSDLPTASTTTAGIAETATDVEAQALSSTSVILTPSNIAALRASQAEAEAGTATDRLMTPQRVAQAIAALSSGGAMTYLGTSGDISAGTAAVSFTTAGWFASTYLELLFEIVTCRPATDAVNFHCVGSTDGGTSYLAGTNYDYVNNGRNSADASKTLSAAAAAQMIIHTSDTIGNATNEGISGYLWLKRPSSTTEWKHVLWQTLHYNTTTVLNTANGWGAIKTTSAINALRFLFSSGNFSAGRINVYGLRNS